MSVCHAGSVEDILNMVRIDAKVGWGIVGINATIIGKWVYKWNDGLRSWGKNAMMAGELGV